MKTFRSIPVLALLIAVISASDILACTTFCMKSKGEVLFGKNYDWMIGDGLIFVNKRGVAKFSQMDKNPARWESKYGSITFNQYGRETPSGGMNEAGLVIEIMWLDGTKYPASDERPEIGVMEWVHHNLDTAATVAEVIRNTEGVRVFSPVMLHYLVADKNGDSTTIEFLDVRLVAHTGDKLPVATLTNDTYASSLEYAKKTDPATAKSISSLDRFARASKRTSEFSAKPKTGKEAVDYAFETLADAAQPGYTQWSIVYDQKRGKVYFRTLKSPAIKMIDTRAFDYACGSVVKMLDIDTPAAGEANSRFIDYTREGNRGLIERSFRGTPFLKDVPAIAIDQNAAVPEKFGCAASPSKAPIKAVSRNNGGYLPAFASRLAAAYLSGIYV